MQIFEIGGTSTKNENDSWFPALSYRERLIGFAFCFFMGMGVITYILSFGSFIGLLAGSPTKFAISYSIGNVLSLFGYVCYVHSASTCFLVGFKKQIENMADKERRIASIVFVLSLIMLLLSAILLSSAILVLIFLILEFCSYTWYVASYIPFARDCIKSCLGNIIKS